MAAARLGDWSYDFVSDVVTFSERGAEIFGIPPGPHMTWTAMRELLHPEDREEARQAVEDALANRTDYACQYRVRRLQGGWTWVAANGRGQYDAEGRVVRMLGIVQDITARRMMETEMRREIEDRQRAEQRLSFALKAARMSDWTWDAARDEVLLTERVAAIVGIEPGVRLSNEAMQSYIHPDDRERVRAVTRAAIESRTEYAVEHRLRNTAGAYVWVAVNARGLFDAEGKLTAVTGILQEIDERKAAEERLRAREAQLAFVSTNAPTLLSHLDREGRFRFVNKAFADRWQKAPEEFIGKTIAEVAGPQAAAAAQPFIDRVLAGETVTIEREIEYRDLGVRYMKGTYSPEYDAEGKVCGWLSAATDLTERWQAEQALRQSEARLRLATRSGKVGLWEWDVPGNRVTWTDSLFEIHGVKREEFSGTVEAFAALIHPDDRGPVERALRSSLEHDLPYELEFRALRPGGSTIWLYTNAVVVKEGDQPRWMLGATVDITARKQAELGLRESEARFRALTKHAPVGIFLTDTNGEAVFVNDKVRELSGLGIDEMRGQRWTLAIHPDDRERVAAEWQGAVTRNEPFHTEYRFQRPDGRTNWVQASAVEHRNASGMLVGFIGTLVDITERKAAGAALRESEKRFRTLASHAPVGIFLTDPQGDTIFVNESWSAMTGLSLLEAGGGGWANAIHPDDRARVAAGWAEALEQNRASAAEYRFIRADGKVTWVQGQAVQLRDSNGQLVGYIGTVADFTSRKATEERLREREAELRLIATHAPIILAHCDAEQRFLFVNRAYAERFGLTVETVTGRTVREVLGEVVHTRLAPYIARVLQGETFSFEDEIPYEKIGNRFMRAAYTPDLAEDGSVRGYLCAITDLSDRRAMEDELRRRTRSLEILNRVASQLAAERDLEKVVQSVTDAGRELSGAAFGAFFYNVTNETGESYTLYTLSGVPREAFEKFPMPRATKMFGPTFRGEGAIRIGDVRKDERYGHNAPYQGMPAGHLPVSSYLAVPVISRTGEVLGGLFFGHPEPDRFTEEAERTVSNLAAQAAIAIDNTNLYRALERELREKTQAEEGLRQAQQELLAHAGELERRVEARTASLSEAITQMEEFSYSVSHDLRAPLRAMNAYAQALIEDYGTQLDDTARNYLDRIQRSSVRMEKLTHDVLSYSRVARAEIKLGELDLTQMVHDVVAHYRELQEPAARVTVHAPLLRVLGHESSLGQALANLLTNAVKFVTPGVKPEIDVRTESTGERVRIWIQDNGIGIAPEYQERLFQVFERVPTRGTYEGTGIGLAIVRKAVEKMSGTCGVVSDGRSGSRFWIELSKA